MQAYLYKGLRVLCTTSFSNNFSLFQLETKTNFYKQFFGENYILENAITNHFVPYKKSVTEKRT